MKLIYTPTPEDSHLIELETCQQLHAGVPTEVPDKLAAALLRDHPKRFEAVTATPNPKIEIAKETTHGTAVDREKFTATERPKFEK